MAGQPDSNVTKRMVLIHMVRRKTVKKAVHHQQPLQVRLWIGMRAHQMISPMRRWFPDRSIKLMSDTAYSILELGLHAWA